MIRTATRDDLPALRALFSRSNDAPYDLSAVAEEKCFGHGLAGEPAARVFERDGQILGVAVSCGKWLRLLAVDRDERRRGIGTALLEDADRTVIAAEPGNYFVPGVPLDDAASLAFFRARGFLETQSTWNMHLTLGAVTFEGRDVRRPSHDQAERVMTFVEREFGRTWRFEAAKAFEREVPPAFIAVDDGVITGFVVHDVNNRGLGFFGPTGVSLTKRGRGVGGRLLIASLADMRAMGYTNIVIPWTDALDFYRKVCGAEPAYQFATMVRA